MIYATAGHVDHGKTSLVKALTNVDTDRLADEKARGLTIDLGFAYLEQNGNRIGFVDVPGHAKFISNMLAGVSTIDHALIVIAADDGPMPQTLEHIAILQTLGITEATIAITKVDRVSAEHLSQTQQSIDQLLQQTPYRDAKVFLTSAAENTGIVELKTHLIDKKRARGKSDQEHFRLAIDRKFTIKGAGVVVTGSIFSGQVDVGSEVYVMPQAQKARVRSLHRQDSEASLASVGDRCALNISGTIEHTDIERGNWITSNPELPISDRLDCEVSLLAFEAQPLRTGTPVHFHLGAQHTTGRLFLLEQRHLNAGETALVQVRLATPLSGCVGDRFVIRDQSATRTLGGGEILDPFSVTRGRSKPERLNHLRFLQNIESRSDLDGLLKQNKEGIDLKRYANGLNKQIDLSPFRCDGGGKHHHNEHINQAKTQILATLKTASKSQAELGKALGLKSGFLSLVLQALIQDKNISQEGSRYSLPELTPTLSKPAETLWQKVEPLLAEQPLQPPVISELSKRIGLPAGAVDKLLGECIKQGLIVRPIKNRYFLKNAMQTLRVLAQEVANSNNGQFTVIQFRDHSGLGRNLCIELLEHLDAKGFTKRMGDQRIIQDSSR